MPIITAAAPPRNREKPVMLMSPTSQTFVTFAYGSNMLTRRIKKRCPSATPVGIATLVGHELRWHKRSRDESGKCDVVETALAGAVVLGVLFRIALAEKPALDSAEGLGNGYEEKTVTVTCNGEAHNAFAYFATDIDDSLRPYTWYKALVVTGAKEHGLPAGYVARLELVEAQGDPDHMRHAKNMATVNDSPDAAQ
jgi:gamma-glutamylcyclotransferase